MKEVAFSSLTFVDGTGLLVRRSTAGNSLMDLAGKKIGVITGTSNERALAEAMKSKMVTATMVPVSSREDGLAQLEAGTIDAFANDRVLLVGLAAKAKELSTAMSQHIAGLTRVQLLPPDSAKDNSPRRMTAESIKSETLVALRKRDPVLAAAIDELDLDLIN